MKHSVAVAFVTEERREKVSERGREKRAGEEGRENREKWRKMAAKR